MLKTILWVVASCGLLVGCHADNQSQPLPLPPLANSIVSPDTATESEKDDTIAVDILVADAVFTAQFYDNETTRALTARFPMTIEMDELNGREKKYDLPENLPATSTEQPETISTGEIMSWSGNVLVLFYKDFSNSYNGYVRLGKIDNPSGLATALGSGPVQVTWSLAE